MIDKRYYYQELILSSVWYMHHQCQVGSWYKASRPNLDPKAKLDWCRFAWPLSSVLGLSGFGFGLNKSDLVVVPGRQDIFLVVAVIAWKRSVGGVRELCDVCATTLFNIHWTCFHCGFTACIDCYGTALRCERTISDSPALDNNDLSCALCRTGSGRWINCTSNGRASHRPTDLTVTQIIPFDGISCF